MSDWHNNRSPNPFNWEPILLEALRAAGFDVYRPEGCPLVDYWQDTPDDKVALVDGDGRRIYGAGIPDGRYRLVPVGGDS